MRTRVRSESGFSLPEVVIAAGLFAGAMTTFARLLVASVESDLHSRFRTSAMVLAQQKQEDLLAALSNDGGLVPGGTEPIDATGHSGNGDGRGRGDALFVRRWWVEPLPDSPAGALLVRVEVGVLPGAGRLSLPARVMTVRRRPEP